MTVYFKDKREATLPVRGAVVRWDITKWSLKRSWSQITWGWLIKGNQNTILRERWNRWSKKIR